MKRRIVSTMLTVTVVLLGGIATARGDAKVSLQYRPRIENKGAGYRTPKTEGSSGYLEASHRARLGIKATHPDVPNVSGAAEIQDVRFFGEESDTLADYTADTFDLHQGFVDAFDEIRHIGIRVGRQELNYDEHRLLGNVDWTQQGRSHDAAVLRWESGAYAAHLGGAKHLSAARLQGGTYKKAYPSYTNYNELLFLWAKAPAGPVSASYYAVFDTPPKISTRFTTGPRLESSAGGIQSRAEAYYQITKQRDMDRASGYLVGLSAGKSFSAGPTGYSTTAAYDFSSPDFGSLYPTAHKWFGTMDLFLAFPADTNSKGLHDPALKLSATGTDWKLLLDLHYFMLAEDVNGEKNLGPEVDITLPVKFNNVLTLTAGVSAFFPGPGMENLKGTTPEGGTFTPASLETGYWSFLMLDAKF
ncbi:MAG: alginate export family protein [Nitrospirae bacterium]|nr:alginate export family protein [Nitrospirota bacterium]